MALDLVEEKEARTPSMIRMTVHFSKKEIRVKQKFYSLAFYSISPLQFYRTVFHFKSCFGEGSWNSFDRNAPFPLGIWNSFFYFLFLPTEMARNHKFIGFRFYFCRFCIWFSPCWGGPSAFMPGLIAFPSNAVVYRSLPESNP